MNAARALLADIVDYAGVFPPAALELETAVQNFASYRRSDDSWMLGAFVVQTTRLDDTLAIWKRARSTPDVLAVSAVAGGDVASDLAQVHDFNRRNASVARVDAIEAKLASPSAIRDAAAMAGDVEIFAEIPIDADPASLVDEIARRGINAKVRTGGVTVAAFPPAVDVVRFMRRCIDAGVRFKATAGLHHPLRAEYCLTYAPDAPCGSMFGFLNVFLAAAFMANGASDGDAEAMLLEQSAAAFAWSDGAVSWNGSSLSADQLADVRARVAASFGSCSFREPVEELAAMGVAT